MAIDVENLSAEAIRAMGPAQVLDALDACIDATCVLSREAISAETTLAAIEIAWAQQNGDFPTKGAFEAARRAARRDVRVATIRNQTLKRIQSAIQSKVRRMP